MAKKAEKKTKKEPKKVTRADVEQEQQKLLDRIVELQDFCVDNLLALEPLLDEEGDTFIVEARINQFQGLLDILDLFEILVSREIPEETLPDGE